MSDRILVGTHKGLFTVERGPYGWTIGDPQFLAEPVSMTLADPRDGWMYAALNLGHFGTKLHRLSDGCCWEEVTVPRYPKVEGEEPPPVPEGFPPPDTLKQIWSL